MKMIKKRMRRMIKKRMIRMMTMKKNKIGFGGMEIQIIDHSVYQYILLL